MTCDRTAVCTISEGVGTLLVTLGLKWRTVVAQAPGAPPVCVRITKFHYSDTIQDRVVGCGSPAPETTRYWFLDAPPRLATYSLCVFCESPDTTCVVPGPAERGWVCGTAAGGSEEWLAGCAAR